MKILLLILTAVAASENIDDLDTQFKWRIFQNKFQKSYKSTSEMTLRFAIFNENFKRIENHNRMFELGETTYKQGITQFTDWTTDEFLSYINKSGLKLNRTGTRNSFMASNFSIPDSVDWRLERAVSEVKNQGHCGSCWSFSATGAMEGQAQIKLGKRISLSEQNLIDCAITYGSQGCNGGNVIDGFLYARDTGIVEELEYPYTAHQEKCKEKASSFHVKGYNTVYQTEQALQRAVAQIGPISVAIEATSLLQNYVGGVFFDHTCSDHLNHAVLAVGYGIENGNEYWLIKNSWGPSWGEQGYLKLARNKYNNCGVANYASYPII